MSRIRVGIEEKSQSVEVVFTSRTCRISLGSALKSRHQTHRRCRIQVRTWLGPSSTTWRNRPRTMNVPFRSPGKTKQSFQGGIMIEYQGVGLTLNSTSIS